MRIAVFNTKPYDREYFTRVNTRHGHELVFFEVHLSADTAGLAKGFGAVCVFVNDIIGAELLEGLAAKGVRLIVLRCAGFNNVDLEAAREAGLTVARVPAYSPCGVAEHTIALILSLNRKIHRAYNRVRDGNFSIDGLLGFELHDRTAGVIGTGKIGAITARILGGFGCRLAGYDPFPSDECRAAGVEYLSLDQLFERADIITLHAPLNPGTRHMINAGALSRMKDGVMIINTSRGGLIDTPAVIEGLKSGKVGYPGLDVYEEEEEVFFEDLSGQVLQDDLLARLLTFPNVLITGHQAFFTGAALTNIAETTLHNVTCFEKGAVPEENLVTEKHFRKAG